MSSINHVLYNVLYYTILPYTILSYLIIYYIITNLRENKTSLVYYLKKGATKWTRGIPTALEPLVQTSCMELVLALFTCRSR